MNNFPVMVVLVAVLISLLVLPFWLNLGASAAPPEPSLATASIQGLDRPQCVEPAPYMRAHHPELLARWRELVVRQGLRHYTSSSGVEYTIDLESTCLGCHSNRQEFCDACHDYVSVDPGCWNCHERGERVP